MSPEGIQVRHRATCASHHGGRCACTPTYRATVYSRRDQARLTRSFGTLAEARRWRADTYRDVSAGARRGPSSRTVRQAAEVLLEGMVSGAIRTRSGDAYKPSVVRSYEAALRRRVIPELGGARLSDVQRGDLQRLADEMLAQGADASTIRNALMPLRVIFRRAVQDGEVGVSPCTLLRLPAVRGRRERIASPDEAVRLIAALPIELQALYGVAVYAGLRRGELRALRWRDLDLGAGRLDVRHAMDDTGTLIAPKTKASRRTVPIVSPLHVLLDEHQARAGIASASRYVFGDGRPFTPSAVRRRAQTAWRRSGLAPIGLHECRHTFASILIAAGLNAKAVSVFCGHSSIQVTYDLYGKLMPGSEAEMLERVEHYLGHYTTQDTTVGAITHG